MSVNTATEEEDDLVQTMMGLLRVNGYTGEITQAAQQAAGTLPWVAALGLVGALLLTAVFNFLVRETLAIFHHAKTAVPVTGTHEPGLLRWAWAFAALAGLAGAVLVIIVINATSSDPSAAIESQLAGPTEVLMMAVTTFTACLTAGMLAFNFLLLKHRVGSALARIYYLTVTLAWLSLMVGLYFTNWLRLS